jgi:hypothetical protein
MTIVEAMTIAVANKTIRLISLLTPYVELPDDLFTVSPRADRVTPVLLRSLDNHRSRSPTGRRWTGIGQTPKKTVGRRTIEPPGVVICRRSNRPLTKDGGTGWRYRERTDAAAVVRSLYQAYQDRDWSRARTFLHPEAVVEMPGTSERLEGRDAIVAFQRAYPEPWGVLTVKRQWVMVTVPPPRPRWSIPPGRSSLFPPSG